MSKKKKEKKEDKKKLSKEEKKLLKKEKKKDGKKNKEKEKKKDKKKNKVTGAAQVIKPKLVAKTVVSKGTPGRKRISSIVNPVGTDISLHHNAKIAVSRLRRLQTTTEIDDFIKGDVRETVLKVAEIVKSRLKR